MCVGLLSRKRVWSHRTAHPIMKTHARQHTHTRYHSILQQRRRWRGYESPLLLLAVSQRGTFLAPPASSVYHTMTDGSSVRYRRHFPQRRLGLP